MYIRELLEPSLINRVLIPDRPFNSSVVQIYTRFITNIILITSYKSSIKRP